MLQSIILLTTDHMTFGQIIFRWLFYISITFVITSVVYLFAYNSGDLDQQFAWQATSFIHGQLDIPKSHDSILFNGKYYWGDPPFPSIVLIPFKIISNFAFDQSIAQLVIIALLTFLLYKLARLKNFSQSSAWYLTFSFLFGSFVIGLITHPSSWYFGQVVSLLLLTLFLYEFETKKRIFILGVIAALLIITRPTASLVLLLIPYQIFFQFYKRHLAMKVAVKKLLLYSLPIALSVLLYLLFNLLRFGTIFFNAYAHVAPPPTFEAAKALGFLNIAHIPSGIYYTFLISVQPVIKQGEHLVFPFITYSPYGLSFFITSPFFIYAFKSLLSKERILREYWSIILVTLLVLLSFFGMPGYTTFGPRYLADVFPILYLMLLYSLHPPNLSRVQKIIILCSALFNAYLLLTPYLLR